MEYCNCLKSHSASEMTYIVSSGALNSTHSLVWSHTHASMLCNDCISYG